MDLDIKNIHELLQAIEACINEEVEKDCNNDLICEVVEKMKKIVDDNWMFIRE
jgi:hypothetical protein